MSNTIKNTKEGLPARGDTGEVCGERESARSQDVAGSTSMELWMPHWMTWKESDEGEFTRSSLDEAVMIGTHATLNENLLIAFRAGFRCAMSSQPDRLRDALEKYRGQK